MAGFCRDFPGPKLFPPQIRTGFVSIATMLPAAILIAGSVFSTIVTYGDVDCCMSLAVRLRSPKSSFAGSCGGIEHEWIDDRIETTRIAPTILKLLGLPRHELEAVQIERTKVLADLERE